MADDDKAELLRVFLASPGDVGEERAFVRQYLESVLPKSSFLPRPVAFDVVSWDDPAAGVPMPAHLTLRFKRASAECDLVIGVLWGRLGTHLDPASLVQLDGGGYLSGTEWEYENAFNAPRRPDILVYQRLDNPKIDLRGPGRAEALEQLDRVGEFVGRFKDPDGLGKGGFHGYEGLDAFKRKLANDLETLVAERLRRGGKGAAPDVPAPNVAAVPLPDRCIGRDVETKAAAVPRIAVLARRR